MEMLLPPDLVTEPIRPLKRVEYEKLAAEGYFDDERVEPLFGMVVERHWQSVTSHGRGERIALRQFPDVAVTVDEILPPAA